MNRYALIKDSINDNIFGVVVDSNGLSKFYGVSAKGIEWSKWANGISVKSANDGLPAGIVVGEYSPLRNDNSGYVQALVDTVSLRNPSVNRKQGISDSLVKNSSSVTPSVRDAELRAFDTDKRADAINFKARAFRTDSKVTSLLTQVRAEKLGFVSSDGAFTSRNPVSIPEVKQAEIIDTYGRSIQRAIGKNLIRKKSARMVTVVRAVKQTASGIEFKAAGLGPKIGSRLSGGLRAAPAGMSFVDVTGVTDADTDGIVFEGKPGLERPIIPRFIVPKDLARKLSGIVEGDAEAIEKQRRAGNTSVQFDEGKLRKIIESVGGDANLLTAVTGEDGIPATTPSGRERLSVSAPKPSGIARDIARDAVIGGRLRSNQRPDLGDPTPLSPGELKKLSQQDLVDRLLEDRFAGLNLEEAARKYGLKGGRAEARRLEAREMQRRRNEGINMPDGMRSRQTTPSGNRLFTQEEFDAFFYDAVPFTEDADFRIYVSDPRDRGKWLKRDEVQVEAGNSFGEMLLDEFPGRLSFLDDVGYSLASFDTDDLSDEERIELSDALSYFPELLSGFEEYPSDGDGMRSRTTPPFVTREDGFNFDDQIDISDPDVEDAMWNWLGRPNDGELRKTGGLEKYWDRFKNSDEYRDLENDLLSDALKKSGATPKNPVTISSGSNKYVNATVKYDGEKFIIESQRWDVQAEKVVDGPGDGEEFDSLNEAEEFVSSVVGDSIGYEGMRSRSSSARKVRDFVTSELDDRTISKIRQQLKDIAGNVDEDSQPWEFDAEYLGDALGLTGRWGSVDEVEGALMKGIGDILDSVISGIEDRIADNPDQVNEYGALYDFASAVRNLLGRPDAEWTKPDVDDSEAILEFNDRPYLAIAKTDDGEFVVLQGTVLPSFDYYEQDSFDLEEIGGPFKTMDEAIEAGNKAYRKERFSESMLSAEDDRMDIARTADENISIEREAEDAWDNLNDLDKYRMVEEYAISRGANPGGNDWDPSEWEPDVMQQWMDDYISEQNMRGLSGFRSRSGMRSASDKPAQNLVQRTLERSDVGFGGYARWDDDTYDLFETAGRILDGEVFGGADYTEAFEDRRDRIADGEYLEELSDDDRQLVADIFDRAANASRQDGMRSRRGMRSARPRSDEPGLRDNQIAGDMILVEYGILDDAIRLMRRDNKLSKEEVNSLEPLSDAIADASDGNDMIVMDRSDFARAKQAVDKWMSDPDNLPGGDVADLQDVLGEMENADEDGNIFTSLLLEEQGTRLSMPPASRGGMRSLGSTNVKPMDKREFYIDTFHVGPKTEKWTGVARVGDVESPTNNFTGDSDVYWSDKIILSAPSDGGGKEGKVYIAEINEDAGTITVSWGKANNVVLTSKTYTGQTRNDFFKLLNGKEKRGYRLEGGSVPPLYGNQERQDWRADHDDQRRQGLRSTTATDDRPYYNVPVTGSSALRQVSFDPKKNELIVTYANGKTYTYENFTGDDLNSALDDPNAPGGVGQGITGSIMNKIKKTHSFREGGQHTFDPEYQRITGPGQRTGRSRLSRSGSGTKTQIPVSESSAIEALTWDDKKKDLIVTYKGGRTYTYKDVDDYWVGDLEEDDAGTGRIINNIKKEGYQVIEGGEHGEMPSEGLTAERGRFGMRSRASREKNLPLTEWAGEKPGKENLKPNADLGGADLSNQDLSKYDLSGAVLGLSDLSDSKLPIGLDRANLDEAILEDVDGSFVSLTGASLNEAILSGSDFSNANMTEARLIDAFFYQANLSEANLKLAQAHTAYFDEANLEGANLENITATRASFKNANMRRANLAGADLRLADLRNADLTSANLENANITGANIDGADFEGANLEGVTLPDGWEIVDGEVQRVDENRTGIDGFRSRSGVQKYGSGVVSNGRILYQDDVSRINRGGKTRINIGNSRAVRAVTWDDDNRDLIVTFGSGRTYTYEGVNDDLIRELEEDPASVGSIINKIKNTRVPFTEGGTHAPQSTLYSEVQRQREALGMRSRMAPSASRIRAAEMEVSARPQGMASRRSEGLRDARFAVPGRDRVDPSDGQLWARLSDEDKKTVADRAVQREKFLLGEFKKRFPNWWRRANAEAEKNGWDKELMGGRNAGWLDELHRFVTKLSDDPNYPEKARLDAERDFNDLQALFNMRSNRGQHDLLEHLNPTSRRYLFDDARRADGKTTKISSSGKEMKTASTAPRPFGEPVDTGNPIREQVGEKQKKPLKERLDAFYKRMSDKILYEDPARKQRREMRKARRQGINVGGFTQAEANPVDDAKRKIRKRKRLKEMRKYRSRDVETISKESQKNRVDGKLAHTADSGEMVFGEKLVPTLSTMMENYRTSKKLKKTTGSTNRNKALAVLWDGAGYNGTPQIITPEEFKTLHAAGWVPVVRGHGTGPNGARYADDWIDSPIRFIPGQGGEAQGEGEYWARPTQGGGGWFSWMDSKLPAGTVALLPPSTRRVSKNELRKIQSEHAPLAKAIKQFDSGLPEGEREKMSAEEYVSGLRDYIQSTLGPTFESTMSTRMGKMTSQILDSLSGASGADKKQLLDALEFLELISKQRTVNSYAPLLGYDSIIADSGVELIHNRTAVVVVGDTFTRDDAVNLAKSKA